MNNTQRIILTFENPERVISKNGKSKRKYNNVFEKLSTNDMYSGIHWAQRKKIVELYHRDILRQLESQVYTIDDNSSYVVEYAFEFEKKPLDASNCGIMAKLIEDVLFNKNDDYKKIRKVIYGSSKADQNRVIIEIQKVVG